MLDGRTGLTKRSGALERARDILERTCQYVADELPTCLELADGYRTGKYPEPVHGRGTAAARLGLPRLRGSRIEPQHLSRSASPEDRVNSGSDAEGWHPATVSCNQSTPILRSVALRVVAFVALRTRLRETA